LFDYKDNWMFRLYTLAQNNAEFMWKCAKMKLYRIETMCLVAQRYKKSFSKPPFISSNWLFSPIYLFFIK